MAIIESIIVQVAAVEVNDEYRVELSQLKKTTDFSPTQARDLATELVEAAERAELAIAEDIAARQQRMTAAQPAAVGGKLPF